MEPTPISKNRIHFYYRIKLNPALQITQVLTKVCLLVLVVFTVISVYILLSPKVKLSQNQIHEIKDHTRQYAQNTATMNEVKQGGITKDIEKGSEIVGKTKDKFENKEKKNDGKGKKKDEIINDNEKEREMNRQTEEDLKNVEKEREKKNRKVGNGKGVLRNKNKLQNKEENNVIEAKNGINTKYKDQENNMEKENRGNILKTTKSTDNNQIRVIKTNTKGIQQQHQEQQQQQQHQQQQHSLKVSETATGNNKKLEASKPQTQSNNTETDDLITVAKRMSKNNTKTVLVAAINDGYTRLAYNWLCNTKDMGIHKQVLFVVFDEKFTKKLQKDWPEVTSIYYKGINDKGNMYYGTAGYARIVLYRVQIIMNLLQNDVKILLFETDFVWFRNPLPFLENITDYDLAVTKASLKDVHEMYCIGFVFMYPTVATKSLWKNLSLEMQKVYEKVKSWDTKKSTKYEHGIEQNRFSHLLYNKYGGIKYKVLPELKFPDGQWYLTMATKQKQYDPILIHNNFVLGNGIKEFKAKMFGHWFIKDDLSCNNKKAELGLHKSKKPDA